MGGQRDRPACQRGAGDPPKLIYAAGAYAEGQGEAPAELTWAHRTDLYGLPYAGGWLDQPAGLLGRMEAAKITVQAVRSWREAANWGAWKAKNKHLWKIVSDYLELKKHYEQ